MNFKNRLTLPGILFVTIVVVIGLSRGYRWTRGPASTSTEKQMESGRPSPTASALVAESYARLPLSFEINHGQTDPQVKFLSRGSGYTLFLTRNEAVLALAGANQTSKAEGRKAETRFSRLDTRSSVQLAGRGRLLNGTKNDKIGPADVLRMQLVNANSAAKVSGAEQLPGKSNYFLGNDPMKWRTNIPTYAKVKYEGVYRGIDLVYYGNQHQLEYDFVVAPGADPRAIRLAFESASQTGRMPAIDSDGNLRVV